MRIIGGKLKGIRFHPPIGLPTRPTTDRSKEALFNILNNQMDFEGINALDLFSGTGNISIELGVLEHRPAQHGLSQTSRL